MWMSSEVPKWVLSSERAPAFMLKQMFSYAHTYTYTTHTYTYYKRTYNTNNTWGHTHTYAHTTYNTHRRTHCCCTASSPCCLQQRSWLGVCQCTGMHSPRVCVCVCVDVCPYVHAYACTSDSTSRACKQFTSFSLTLICSLSKLSHFPL